MIAHIISTGDELLLGDIVDTNASSLCRRLRDAGIRVDRTFGVGDDPELISETLMQSSCQADVCMVTGGLGPTRDDLTAQAAADAAGLNLILNNDALASMKTFFIQHELEWTLDNEKQAMLPAGAAILHNACGTAPGFSIQLNRCTFFFLPGPPVEMKKMFQNEVIPLIKARFNPVQQIIVDRITVFMLKESALGARLGGFESRFPAFSMGIRVSFPTIEVKIRFKQQPSDINIARSRMDDARQWVLEKLGSKVVSPTGRSLVEEIAALLMDNQKTLAVAESCTGGLISNMITDLSGSSQYFLLSAVTYANEAKVRVLNVSEATLEKHGAVHEQTALEMAAGARQAAKSDYAVSTTGIAGPTGGTEDKPVGRVCIGLATPDNARAKTFDFKFADRDKNKKMFACAALEMLRQHLVSEFKTV